MGFFDRFKDKKGKGQQSPEEKPAERSTEENTDSIQKGAYPAPPEADTMAVLLLRRNIGWDAVAKTIENRFGSKALVFVDNSKPNAPTMLVQLEGVEFWCSYLGMPHPPQVCDFSQIKEGLFSDEEQEEIVRNQAFLVLAQKGGGTDLASKRNICRLFTRLAGTLMELEDAVGAYVNGAELLVSRRLYLKHSGTLEENWNDSTYFPAPLWVSLRRGKKGGIDMTGTWGLRQFGLLEAWFLDNETEWPELFQRLLFLSIFQITEKDLYKDKDTIQFTPGKTSIFKELKGALFIVESD